MHANTNEAIENADNKTTSARHVLHAATTFKAAEWMTRPECKSIMDLYSTWKIKAIQLDAYEEG